MTIGDIYTVIAVHKNLLLNEIDIYSENTFVHKYNFQYISYQYALLKEITEYGSDGTTYNPTYFKYGDGSITYPINPNDPNYSVPDYNQDYISNNIKQDYDQSISVQYPNTDPSPNAIGHYYNYVSGDMKGDGKDEIIIQNYNILTNGDPTGQSPPPSRMDE